MNVVCKRGWVLERLASELQAIPGLTVNCGHSERVAFDGGPNYYMPGKDAKKHPAEGVRIGLYTHGNSGWDLIPTFDACVAMNRRMADRLGAARARNVHLIRPGVWSAKRVLFGVIGRVYTNGRKGEDLVRQAVAAGFSFIACAPRREGKTFSGDWGCSVQFDANDEASRRSFYSAIDYLVVTSLDEGGPMTVPEAIACGVPVIAPDVGWCWEFPVLRYVCGNWGSLRSVLTSLVQTPTWAEWIEAHRRLFASLKSDEAAA